MKDIMVSICCATYNHEKYIKDALDSFLMQDVDFKYEILVHDDCSTDNTREIIEQYKKIYPEIINIIYQKENQFSKNRKIFGEIIFPKTKGKYVAMCEGDDYWLDKEKLKKQVEILENNKEIVAVVSGSECVDENKNFRGYIGKYKENEIIDLTKFLQDFYTQLPKHLFQTASIVFRRDAFEEIYEKKIQFYYNCPVGDLPLYLFLLTKGKIYCFKDNMAAYRQNISGSWTKEVWAKQRKQILEKMLRTYKEFNEYTNYEYENEIIPFFSMYEFEILLQDSAYKELLKRKYRVFFNQLNLKSRIYILMHAITSK